MGVAEYVKHLESGGVLAYPTETVWGLGVDINNEKALDRLFEVKGRSPDMPVSILVRDISVAIDYAEVSPRVKKFMELVWPGPVTLVLPAKDNVSEKVHAGSGFVGIRNSSDPFLRDLMMRLSFPITTTSANRSGESPTNNGEELSWLPEDVLLVKSESGGDNNSLKGSTVVRIVESDIEVLRDGDFDSEDLLRLWFSVK